jgi:hypothetical protein
MITKFNEFEQLNEGLFTSPAKVFINYANNYIFTPDMTTPFIELYPDFKPTSNYSDVTGEKFDRNTVNLNSGKKGENRPEPYQAIGKMGKYMDQSIKIRMKNMTDDFQSEHPEYVTKFNMMNQTVSITKKEE